MHKIFIRNVNNISFVLDLVRVTEMILYALIKKRYKRNIKLNFDELNDMLPISFTIVVDTLHIGSHLLMHSKNSVNSS